MSEMTAAGLGLDLLDAARVGRLNALYEQIRGWLATDREQARYGQAAAASEDALCCPVEYDPKALSHIPRRVLDIDYGCGDPTIYAEEGMRVLDLGSGSGKHAFMIARKVGPDGRVFGVDKTPEMLALSRGAVDEVTEALGYPRPNVEFRHGHIENLRVDKDRLLAWLDGHEVRTYQDLEALDAHLAEAPLVDDGSVDLIISNCVLNLVGDGKKGALLAELYRVLDPAGSVAVSDIVSDVPVPAALKDDPELWTGCLSGAWARDRFLAALSGAGFHGVTEVKSRFWKRVEGINFFSVTVRAWKGKRGPCYETLRSAMYRGPFSSVVDDDGHVFERGVFTPVCEKTANLLTREPYGRYFHVSPALEDPARKLRFDCGPGAARRDLTSGQSARLSELIDQGACCEEDGCC